MTPNKYELPVRLIRAYHVARTAIELIAATFTPMGEDDCIPNHTLVDAYEEVSQLVQSIEGDDGEWLHEILELECGLDVIDARIEAFHRRNEDGGYEYDGYDD